MSDRPPREYKQLVRDLTDEMYGEKPVSDDVKPDPDAEWLEENATGYWREGNPVSPQCQERLLRIAARLRAGLVDRERLVALEQHGEYWLLPEHNGAGGDWSVWGVEDEDGGTVRTNTLSEAADAIRGMKRSGQRASTDTENSTDERE